MLFTSILNCTAFIRADTKLYHSGLWVLDSLEEKHEFRPSSWRVEPVLSLAKTVASKYPLRGESTPRPERFGKQFRRRGGYRAKGLNGAGRLDGRSLKSRDGISITQGMERA